MTSLARWPEIARRLAWAVLYGAIVIYVAARMGAFAFERTVETPAGSISLPDTFATVDHPFHVARAEILWRSISAGEPLRWISQHQGGYPVEFYPLGEAWLEVAVRAASLGSLSAGAAHTPAVIALFLLPGAAFAALAREDGWSPAVALMALALHIALPGGWYHGGYTELVQWGLVTNVAGAVAAFLTFPALLRFLSRGDGWAGSVATLLGGAAIYCNPRSLVALGALGLGAWIGVLSSERQTSVTRISGRLALAALGTALLAAPELMALARFRQLYAFVHYSGYDGLAAYAQAALSAVGWPVILLAVAGIAFAAAARHRLALRSTSAALFVYVMMTAFIAFVPLGMDLAAQLEPTRLMPVQRLLTLYLAAGAIWLIVGWLSARAWPNRAWAPPVVAAALAGLLVLVLTRPVAGPVPDPASPLIPPVSLYPVERAAQPAQADLELAVSLADAQAQPGTAILILGSALSWHQPLWAPLWTDRPLYYDNWLWYWHTRHAGTPGYSPLQGHHYPDPERTLEPGYLAQHGIGSVVVTGRARDAAASSPLLQPLNQGVYDTYLVRDPVTTVTFGQSNAIGAGGLNQWFWATAARPGTPVVARQNWFPRWSALINGTSAAPGRRSDGSIIISSTAPASRAEFVYQVQVLDWVARGLAVIGLAMALVLAFCGRVGSQVRRRWYPPVSAGAPGEILESLHATSRGADTTKSGSE